MREDFFVQIQKNRSGEKMSQIHQLVYISKAKDGITEEEILEFLRKAVEFNSKSGITGTLMYNGGLFLQLLEGDAVSLDYVLEKRIKKSSLHSNLTVLFKKSAVERLYEHWNMSYRHLTDFDLKIINKVMVWNIETLKQNNINNDSILKLFSDFKNKP